jgi:hypothetical protein
VSADHHDAHAVQFGSGESLPVRRIDPDTLVVRQHCVSSGPGTKSRTDRVTSRGSTTAHTIGRVSDVGQAAGFWRRDKKRRRIQLGSGIAVGRFIGSLPRLATSRYCRRFHAARVRPPSKPANDPPAPNTTHRGRRSQCRAPRCQHLGCRIQLSKGRWPIDPVGAAQERSSHPNRFDSVYSSRIIG